jgi:Rrf2 family protein
VFVPTSVDYAVRALLELAADAPARVPRDELAKRQGIPTRYLEAIMAELARSGIVNGKRGIAGGYELSTPADQLTIGAIARAVDGPLALVGQLRPEQTEYDGSAVHLGQLWVGLRAAIRGVLDRVTLADLLAGDLPPDVRALVADPEAWVPRWRPR